jgi:hypothetical protein
METALTTFVTWQAVLFCLGVFVTTFIIRKAVEGTWDFLAPHKQPGPPPPNRARELWEGVILRVMPPIVGVVCAFITTELMHPGVHSAAGKAFYGLVCGFGSSYVYMVVKAVLKKGFNVSSPTGKEGDSLRPAGPPDPSQEDAAEDAPKPNQPTPPEE